MRFKTLLGSIAVIVEQFRARLDVLSGDEYQPGRSGEGHNLCLQIGRLSGVIHKTTNATAFGRRVDAAKIVTLNTLTKNKMMRICIL